MTSSGNAAGESFKAGITTGKHMAEALVVQVSARASRLRCARLLRQGVSLALLTLCAACAPHAAEDIPPICTEFAGLLAKQGRIADYSIDGEEIEEGVWRLRGFDIDGDHRDDEMTRTCPSSGSIVPADPCTLEFTPSTAGKTFILEEQRLFLVNYKSRLYAVTGQVESENGPFHEQIYLLTAQGAKKQCSY